MAVQQQWFAVIPCSWRISGFRWTRTPRLIPDTLGKARELTKRAVDSAIKADSKEAGAIWWENAALREAAYGNLAEARQAAAEGLKLDPKSQSVAVEAALAYAMAREAAGATAMAQDLNSDIHSTPRCSRCGCPAFKRNWR